MTSTERNAALEEAAQWHDAKAEETLRIYNEVTRLNHDGSRPLVIATIAEVHRTSAAAIRALKEPKVAFEELSDEAWGDSWDATFADTLKEQEPTT